MVENIFTHFIFTDYVLPWVLVFVLVFAILERTQVLGEGKRQINAIVGAVAGLLLLAFPASRMVVVSIIPILVVLAVILFVFIMLYSFVSGEKKGDPFNKNVKIGIGVVIALILVVALLIITDNWNSVWDYLTGSNAGANIVFIVIAVIAVVAVLFSSKKKDKED